MSARRQPIASTTLRVRSACGPQRSILQLSCEGAPMSDTILVAGLPENAVIGATGLTFASSRSLRERDEFGTLDGAPGLFRAPLRPAGLQAREDLGHALCAWLPREDLL